MEGIITADEREAMLVNGRRSLEDPWFDPVPVVRLRAPDGPQTWLLTEIDPSDADLAYGLCDLGLGSPEPGSVSLAWIAGIRGPLGMAVERDPAFTPTPGATLSSLARIAAAAGRIIM